ncbi:helix-turn-helix domain-containing protein [Peribacillus loiseleuriae]|uniref:helix-turn-helix domain-containing protein n=1 Tax=Peribacillus loiseleuriae TaxID=1679170 RepID=UPI003D07A9A2
MDSKEFGGFIKDLRKSRGLTLTKLGELMGYSNPYLSQIENGLKGIPSPELLKRYADSLKVDHFDLMGIAGYYEGDDLLDPIHVLVDEMLNKEKPVVKTSNLIELNKQDLKNIIKQNEISYDGKILKKQDLELLDLFLKALVSSREEEGLK